METKSQTLNPAQSLEIINEMILNAKRSFSKISFYFLLWGVLLFIAGLAEYFLQHVVHYEHYYIGWMVAGMLGGILAGVHGAKQGKKQSASSYMDRVYAFLWSAFIVTLILIIIGSAASGQNPTPFILVITGLPTFVSGGVMRFKPLLAGGIIFWAFGIFSFFFLPEYRALIFSCAIVLGYIIPGLMLKKSEDAV